MSTNGQFTLNLLHDLALIYLGLAHGTDEELDPTETHAMAVNLRRWQPDKDPALIDHIIREATMSYLNRENTNRLETAIETLRDALPEQTRADILHDLVRIARADGKVIPEEGGFIQNIANAWNVDLAKDISSLS